MQDAQFDALQLENQLLRERIARLEQLLADSRALLGAHPAPPAALREAAVGWIERIAHDTLLESVREAIVVTDLADVVVYWNAGATRLFGWAPHEVLGRPYAARFPAEVRPHVAEQLRRRRAGEPFEGEWLDYRRDGSRVWTDRRVHLIHGAAGQPVGVMALSSDISARKQAELALRSSEQQLRAIFNSGTDSIILMDREMRVLRYNTLADLRAYEIHGRKLRVGEPLTSYTLTEDEAEALVRNAQRALAGENVTSERSYALGRGAPSWFVFRYSPVRNDHGAIIGVCLTSEDVTAQRQLQAQLAQAQKLDGIGRLAGGVAHDFNNLLAVISGCADIVRHSLPPDSPAQTEVAEIAFAADRAMRLTRQLLTFAEHAPVAASAVSVNDALLAVEKLLRRLAGAQVALELRLDPGLWPVAIEEAQLEQVIVNLVVNARDAMPEGGELLIETANVSGDAARHPWASGEYVRLAISDTGHGMTPEVLEHAFEPFFTTKPSGQGTGLGLATCYGIVTRHGGTITIDSAVGRGTCVEAWLPRA